eukprot:TRINITY_DN854_c0_g1_i2.p3 TRINITY_DN854_c0_g1~~TRINITY_DN854_c0_g1_i2.p3  ORF type:complete len:254 (-),score=37.50 TRINITY_DN854_c0_g1_i2:1719-2375(-)
MNNVSRDEWRNTEFSSSSFDFILQDTNGQCGAYVQQFRECVKSSQNECNSNMDCMWMINVPSFEGQTNACLPSSVSLELLPYKSDYESTISSMATCSEYEQESLCYTESVYLNGNEQQQTQSKIGFEAALIVAVMVAVVSVLAMTGGIFFVAYVNRNMAKYQEMMRRLGINPTDQSLTDFSPLLSQEDEENVAMEPIRKTQSSSSEEKDSIDHINNNV